MLFPIRMASKLIIILDSTVHNNQTQPFGCPWVYNSDIFVGLDSVVKIRSPCGTGPFGFEGRIWDLIVSVPDHCLSFYSALKLSSLKFVQIDSCTFQLKQFTIFVGLKKKTCPFLGFPCLWRSVLFVTLVQFLNLA